MARHRLLAAVNTVGFLLMVGVNFLANYLPINEQTTGEISARYPNLFVPAGFTFSIWGVIYLALGAFVVHQTWIGRASVVRAYQDKIGFLFFGSCLANAAWIIAWHYDLLGFSLLIMVILLLCLIRIYQQLAIGCRVPQPVPAIVSIPFGLYLGWINIATVANVTALLIGRNWQGWGLSPTFWTVLVIAVATTLSLVFLYARCDLTIGLVCMWALGGVAAARLAEEPVALTVTWAAIGGMILIAAASLGRVLTQRVLSEGS